MNELSVSAVFFLVMIGFVLIGAAFAVVDFMAMRKPAKFEPIFIPDKVARSQDITPAFNLPPTMRDAK